MQTEACRDTSCWFQCRVTQQSMLRYAMPQALKKEPHQAPDRCVGKATQGLLRSFTSRTQWRYHLCAT